MALPSWLNLYTWGLVIFWYFSNIGVVMLNKQLLSVFGFKFPVLLTMCHMGVCSIMAYAVSKMGITPKHQIKSTAQLYKVSALALVFCLAIVLANLSLRFIPVSFNQAIGSTTPFFTAAMAAIIMGKREAPSVYAALIPVVLGVVVASGFEPSFNVVGFTAAICATVARALKTVLQGVLLSDSEKIDSMNLLLYMAPIATAALVPATLILEPNAIATARTLAAEHPWFLWLLLLNAFTAYFQNLSNFLVTKATSPLTLQVLGNVKGVVAVVVSVLWFRNPISLYGMLGYGVTVGGVVAYSQAKRRATANSAKEKQAALVAGGHASEDEEAPLVRPIIKGGADGGSTPVQRNTPPRTPNTNSSASLTERLRN